MSINAMTNVALSRRPDYEPQNRLPSGITEVVTAGSKDPTPENTISTTLKTLTTYIPTETLTLYVAIIAVLRPVDGTTPSFTSYWILFAIFILFTPLAVWVTFAVKLITDKKQIPAQWRQWPKWEMLAGTIAYIAWAAALPDTPFTMFPWYSSALAGVLVLVTSTLLTMVTPLLQKELQKTDTLP